MHDSIRMKTTRTKLSVEEIVEALENNIANIMDVLEMQDDVEVDEDEDMDEDYLSPSIFLVSGVTSIICE